MFYTYLWRDASGVPFYVGKGVKRRAWNTTSRSDDFKAVYAQGGCAAEIVDEFILESQAHAHEMELIERYGRREFGGLLVNKTDGGEGTSGYVVSADSLVRRSEVSRKLFADPAVRAKLSKGQRRRWNTETRDRQRAAMHRRYEAPSERTKTGEATRAALKTQDAKAKKSEVMRKRWEDPQARARMAEANQKAWDDPVMRARQGENSSKRVRLEPPRASNTSGFKGVSFHKSGSKWVAAIYLDGKNRHIGRFMTPEAAALAYDAAAFAAWGYDCFLNFPEEIRKAA